MIKNITMTVLYNTAFHANADFRIVLYVLSNNAICNITSPEVQFTVLKLILVSIMKTL
jgi:hypothetical protein